MSSYRVHFWVCVPLGVSFAAILATPHRSRISRFLLSLLWVLTTPFGHGSPCVCESVCVCVCWNELLEMVSRTWKGEDSHCRHHSGIIAPEYVICCNKVFYFFPNSSCQLLEVFLLNLHHWAQFNAALPRKSYNSGGKHFVRSQIGLKWTFCCTLTKVQRIPCSGIPLCSPGDVSLGQ